MVSKKFLFLLTFSTFCSLLFAQKNDKDIYMKVVHFDFNKWEIQNQDKRALKSVVRAAKAQKKPYYLMIIGHTDNIDKNEYNYQLGLKRANAVAQYIIKSGIDSSNIRLYSKGEEHATQNAPDSVRKKNRKAVVILYEKGEETNEPTYNVDSSIQVILNVKLFDAETKKPIRGNMLVFLKSDKYDNKLIYNILNKHSFSTTLFKSNYEISYSSKGYKTKSVSYSFSKSLLEKSKNIVVNVELKKIKVKSKVSFDKILFVGNKSVFLPSSKPHLRRVLSIAKSRNTKAIEIVGHVNYPYHFNQNDTNMIKFNFELSYNRAKAVYNYLVNNGVNSTIITYRGAGNTEMIFPWTLREIEMKKNRRVEVLILEESTN